MPNFLQQNKIITLCCSKDVIHQVQQLHNWPNSRAGVSSCYSSEVLCCYFACWGSRPFENWFLSVTENTVPFTVVLRRVLMALCYLCNKCPTNFVTNVISQKFENSKNRKIEQSTFFSCWRSCQRSWHRQQMKKVPQLTKGRCWGTMFFRNVSVWELSSQIGCNVICDRHGVDRHLLPIGTRQFIQRRLDRGLKHRFCK